MKIEGWEHGVYDATVNTQARIYGYGAAVERTECGYLSCVVRCEFAVLVGEAASRAIIAGGKATLEQLAGGIARQHAKKLIPYVGWVSTGISAAQGVKCFVDCRKQN